MVQIMGKNMKNIGSILYQGDFADIIEIEESIINELDEMTDKDFAKKYPQGWFWYSPEGSILGEPKEKAIINNKILKVWLSSDLEEQMIDTCTGCPDWEKEMLLCRTGDFCYDNRQFLYKDLAEYFDINLGASTPRNVSAVMTDLAKYNNLTLAQLFEQYKG